MIEAGMYIALGFFAAALIALALIPALYKRAVRLTREAILAVNPSSYSEVRAVQDFERAQHALTLRKIETALERERETATRHRAETGRLQAEVATLRQALGETLKKLDKRKRKGETGDIPSARSLDELREKLKETEQALARTSAELDLLKASAADPGPTWKPAQDTMALATITGLESQIATLKARLAQRHGDTDEDAPLSGTDELGEARAWASQLETELVDAEARYISAQAEVTRLSIQLENTRLPEDHRTGDGKQVSALARDLKWSDNEAARLTALVRDRERALERTSAQLRRLRADLRRSPGLTGLREDLLALSHSILSRETGSTNAASNLHKPKSEAADRTKGDSAGSSSLLTRIIKASMNNAREAGTAGTRAPKATPAPGAAPASSQPSSPGTTDTAFPEATLRENLPATQSAPASDRDGTTQQVTYGPTRPSNPSDKTERKKQNVA